MQTRSLQSLVQIDDLQSFSLAAEAQNLTLSALSMRMKSLEQELGVSLFDRSFRPPRLTPIGARVAEQARNVLAEQNRLMALCEPAEGLAGRFRIGFVQSASVRILPGFLRQASRMAPRAVFDLSSGLSEDLSEEVRSGRLDAAVITRVKDQEEGLAFDLIAREELVFACPSAIGAARLADIPADLAFIHFKPRTGIGKLIAAGFSKASSPPKRIVTIDSIEAAMELVKEGQGYTLLPRPDVERYSAGRCTILKRGTVPILQRDVALITKERPGPHPWREDLHRLLMAKPES